MCVESFEAGQFRYGGRNGLQSLLCQLLDRHLTQVLVDAKA